MPTGLDDFDASSFEQEPKAMDCSSDVGSAKVAANAADCPQSEICNAWDSMLRWYDVSHLIH